MVAIFIHLFALSRLMKHLDAIQIASTFFMQLTDSSRLAWEKGGDEKFKQIVQHLFGGNLDFPKHVSSRFVSNHPEE